MEVNPEASGEGEGAMEKSDASESQHAATDDGEKLTEEGDIVTPNTRKRLWFRNKARQTETETQAQGQAQVGTPNPIELKEEISNVENSSRGWFSTSKRKNSSGSHTSESNHSARDVSPTPVGNDETGFTAIAQAPNDETGFTAISQAPNSTAVPGLQIPASSRMPWLSATQNYVEEDYGADADVSYHSQMIEPATFDSNDVNKDTTNNDESSARRGWFQRRSKQKSSDEQQEGEECVSENNSERGEGEPESPTAKRFLLFGKRRSQGSTHNEENEATTSQAAETTDAPEAEFSQFLDVEDEEGENGNVTVQNLPTPNADAAEEFSNFLDVDDEEKENDDAEDENVSTTSAELPAAGTDERKNGEQNDAMEATADETEEMGVEEPTAEPTSEEKRSMLGFGLFRRRKTENDNHAEEEDQETMSEEEVRFDSSDNTFGTDGANRGTLFDAPNKQGDDAAPPATNEDDLSQRNEGVEGVADLKGPPSEVKSRFRLFSRRTESAELVENEENKVATDDSEPQVEQNTRSSWSLWRKHPKPDDDQVAGDDADQVHNEDEPTEPTKEPGNSADTAAKSSPKESEIEDENVEESCSKEAETPGEVSSRRFRLFSRKLKTPEASETTGEKPENITQNSSTHDEEKENVEKAPSRKFSLFGFGKSKETQNQEPEDQSLQRGQSWASESPPSHWTTATTATIQKPAMLGEDVHSSDEEESDDESEPLHYANHPFASVSRALQENILALLGSGTEQPEQDYESLQSEEDEENEEEIPLLKPKSSVSLIVSPESHKESADGRHNDGALGEIGTTPAQESTLKKVASGTYEVAKAAVNAQQKMGKASVAGAIAGGVAGLMFSGPAGAIVGIRYGQAVSTLGVVLEGSLTVGVIVAGVAGGRFTAEKIQEQIEEQRVLTIGENGVARKVMLVRPTIHIDPAWHEIWAEAQRTSPSSSSSTFNLFSSTDPIKKERYERTSDICEEEEIPTNEKVLLLVSRVLSDKDSFPGHVYRCLMQAFKDRCQQRLELGVELSKDKEEFPHLFDASAEASVNMGDGLNLTLSPRARREDAHGVIKYITATLLEVRPGLASTPEITETTASVVEALVFGEVYDLIYEEIAIEATEQDKRLIEKIDDFEFSRSERTGLPLCAESIISNAAIDALHRLPEMHAAVDKLRYCVVFLERISDHFTMAKKSSAMGADSLLKMVCQHIIAAKMPYVNAEVAFLEEFARDQQLLRGKEGYALVTLQASLHFLNMSVDFERDIFGQDDDEENVPIAENTCEEGDEMPKRKMKKKDGQEKKTAPPKNEETKESFDSENGSIPAGDEKGIASEEAREEKKEDHEAVPEEELL